MDANGVFKEILLQDELEGCSSAARIGNKYFIGTPYDSAYLVCEVGN